MLTNHPFVSGRASRAAALEGLIERARAIDGLWIATCRRSRSTSRRWTCPVVVHRPPVLPGDGALTTAGPIEPQTGTDRLRRAPSQ